MLGMEMTVAEGRVYVGTGLHRKTLQIAVVDEEGAIFKDAKLVNEFEAIGSLFARVLRDGAVCVARSLSAWCAAYRFIGEMGFDIIPSNPVQAALMAVYKNKNDKVDARRLPRRRA